MTYSLSFPPPIFLSFISLSHGYIPYIIKWHISWAFFLLSSSCLSKQWLRTLTLLSGIFPEPSTLHLPSVYLTKPWLHTLTLLSHIFPELSNLYFTAVYLTKPWPNALILLSGILPEPSTLYLKIVYIPESWLHAITFLNDIPWASQHHCSSRLSQ